MANQKVTELTATTSISTSDILYLVSGGNSRQISVANFTAGGVPVGLSATQTLTNKTFTSPVFSGSITGTYTLAGTPTITSPTITSPALSADSVDAITEIASALKSGADATLITGTAGTNGDLSQWNADGDLVDGPTPPSGTIVGTTDTQTLSGKTLTAPKIADAGFIADANGNEQIIFQTTASAVNEVEVTNAATTGTPQIKASGETNVHLAVIGKGNGLTKISVLRQDNTTDSYHHDSVVLTGWGTQAGDDTNHIAEGVTFGITFSDEPIVVATKTSTNASPSNLSDFTANAMADSVYVAIAVTDISTTGFTVEQYKSNTHASGSDSGYTWIAVGSL